MKYSLKLPTSNIYESIFATAVISGIIYCTIYAIINGYLPSPFFYEPSDTFADWFNTAFWARQGKGAYDEWRSIYPPLSFIFLDLFGIDRCYPSVRAFDDSAGLVARSCDWLGLLTMAGLYVLNIALTWRLLKKLNIESRLSRIICICAGMPMLQVLERGNLLMLAYTFVILSLTPLLRSASAKVLFAALAVNMKIYLIGGILALLLKRRWRWVELALISSLIVYIISYAIFGSGSPLEIYDNVRHFAQRPKSSILDAFFAATYATLLTSINSGVVPISGIIGSENARIVELVLPALQYFTITLIACAAFAVYVWPEGIKQNRVVLLALLMIFVSSESGIYVMLYISLFVFLEPWKGFGRIWAITVCYALAVPVDYALDYLPPTPRDTYFRNNLVIFGSAIPAGPLFRPFLIMTIGWAMSLVTLNDIRLRLRAEQVARANPPLERLSSV